MFLYLGAQNTSGKKNALHIQDTIVAEIITELICFESEICICNGNKLAFKRESVSVIRDFLLKFPKICL